jgi:hypothetical protein
VPFGLSMTISDDSMSSSSRDQNSMFIFPLFLFCHYKTITTKSGGKSMPYFFIVILALYQVQGKLRPKSTLIPLP